MFKVEWPNSCTPNGFWTVWIHLLWVIRLQWVLVNRFSDFQKAFFSPFEHVICHFQLIFFVKALLNQCHWSQQSIYCLCYSLLLLAKLQMNTSLASTVHNNYCAYSWRALECPSCQANFWCPVKKKQNNSPTCTP